jgi:methylated-DNA-[protein]-cysteine S-methyltransferase
MNKQMRYTYMESPVGRLLLVGSENGLAGVHFVNGKSPTIVQKDWLLDNSFFADAINQLTAYFNRQLTEFDLEFDLQGTPFQIEVWRALQEIPYGKTISYGELARRINRPLAVRAVGAANGQNPIAIIIPCHRVIGSNGKLTGYGGGMENKEILLALEGAEKASTPAQASLFQTAV